MQRNDDWIRVWDPLIRVFHWALVLSFLAAYLSEDDWQQLHVLAGYTILGLIGFRLLWGLVGSHHARFVNFVQGPRRTLAYVRDVFSARPRRHLGHNPAGAAMVVALLLTLALTTLTGLLTYGHEELSGPLAGFMQNQPYWLGEAMEELHELLANFALLLVGLHVGGVILTSMRHRENLVRSMLHGFKRKEAP